MQRADNKISIRDEGDGVAKSDLGAVGKKKGGLNDIGLEEEIVRRGKQETHANMKNAITAA